MDPADVPDLDAVGRLLDQVSGYYHTAPWLWWTGVGLVVLYILANAWAKRGGKS